MAFTNKRVVIILTTVFLLGALLPADAFGVKQFPFSRTSFNRSHPRHTAVISSSPLEPLYQSSTDDVSLNDQREGMSNAFAALNSLTSLESQEQEEVDDELEEEFLADMMGDLSDLPNDIQTANIVAEFQKTEAEAPVMPEETDVIGSMLDSDTTLEIEDVTDQDMEQPVPNVEDFLSKAFSEAMGDMGKGDLSDTGFAASIAKEVMQDESFKKEIESIYEKAATEMQAEIETMRKEQLSVLEEAREQGISLDDPQIQRLAEAQESAARLIKKVAKETKAVQEAMEDLERAKQQVAMSSLEESTLDLKKGGIVKQAAFVGMALFGSRAVTDAILMVGSSNGGDHTMSAIAQGAIALACAAYFYIVK